MTKKDLSITFLGVKFPNPFCLSASPVGNCYDMKSKIPAFTLNNGLVVPAQGFGCWRIKEETSAVNSVKWAIAHGYRLIDDAAVYMNESFVGRAIKESGIKREDLFVASKVWVQDASYEKCLHAFAKSLERLGVDYLDLYLVHWPLGDFLGAWKAMEELVDQGKIRAIGVSNFRAEDLDNLLAHCRIKPVLNQVECHPLFQQKAMHHYLDDHGILMFLPNRVLFQMNQTMMMAMMA